MPKIWFVRHGKAAAGFGEDVDPGLDEIGHAQAEAAAAELAAMAPVMVRSSPLKRARQTAMPLEARWNARALIDPSVAEIPSPTQNLAERAQWLRGFMGGRWSGASPLLQAWRANLISALLSVDRDCVIFSHYIAINVAAGAALGDERVHVFSPDNASISLFEHDGAMLRLLQQGRQSAHTAVR